MAGGPFAFPALDGGARSVARHSSQKHRAPAPGGRREPEGVSVLVLVDQGISSEKQEVSEKSDFLIREKDNDISTGVGRPEMK